MPLDWFNAREATAVGTALADDLAPQAQTTVASRATKPNQQSRALQELLRRADSEVGALRLNFYKRAKLANSFKWRLLEKGVEKQLADEFTQALVVHLMVKSGPVTEPASDVVRESASAQTGNAKQLLQQGNDLFARRDYAGALTAYEAALAIKPRNADALNNVGATLCRLNRFREAEDSLWRALKIRPDYPEALNNLGVVQQWKGLYPQAEASFRRALKLRPNYVEARSLLGMTLALQGRLTDASAQFQKVLKVVPRHLEALTGMGQVFAMEGKFDQAESWFKRALEADPDTPSALASLAGVRHMTASDSEWLERARRLAAGDISPTEQASLSFAIGKYCDDIGDFDKAFQSYSRGNELLKSMAEEYRREAHEQFVDDLIRVHSREAIAMAARGGSDSARPVFVVGMLRSGTTLAEQIIASHPAVTGAGELGFWSDAGRKYEQQIRQGPLDEPTSKKLADSYLHLLAARSSDAQRVVDKAPVNADYLGIIHAVFPNARIIYMRRNPIDTCLSCYFQQFSQVFNYTVDLSDLAHYYREHHRLMAHWRSVLPPSSLLEMRYEDLIADQAASTRKMLDFIGLEWDDRCLDFQQTQRVVATASTWQVRQKIYRTSIERWRNYEKFIGPLKALKDLAA